LGWKKKRRRRRNGGGGSGGGGGGGGKRSLGSTGVKSRHQTQAALPPSFDPSPPLIQTTLPHFPLYPSRSRYLFFLHAYLPHCPPSAPYPNLRCASTFASF